MKIKDFLNNWYGKEIEDWCGETSPEYRKFQSQYRNVLKDICTQIGFELHSFNKNHYSFSAVLQSQTTEQYYYISISDVRYWKNEWANQILFRTMEHEKDWTGGSNRYSTLQDLAENLSSLDKKIERILDNEISRQVITHQEPQKSNLEDFEVKYA